MSGGDADLFGIEQNRFSRLATLPKRIASSEKRFYF